MKHFILSSTILLAIAAPTFAQDGPGPGGPGEMGHDGGGPPGLGGREGGGPMGRGEMHMRPSISQYEMLRSYIETVNQFARLAGDPTTAGVAAVISAADLLRQHDPKDAIAYLNKVLPDVKNVDVQRAIHLQLIDLYTHAGSSDKALEQLDMLIKGASATTQPTP